MSLFISKTERNCMIIGVPSSVEALAIKHFTLFSAKWIETKVNGYIFDFTSVQLFDKQGYAAFKKFKQEAHALKRQVFSINISKEVKNQFAKDGVDLLFSIVDSLPTAFKNLGVDLSPPKKIDAAIINILIEVVAAEIKKSIQMDVSRGTPFLKKETLFEGEGVIGIITLSGPNVKGLVRLLIPQLFAIGIHKHMYGEETKSISDDVVSFVDELTGQIFGRIKAKLSESGIDVGDAFPSVFLGKPSEIVSSKAEVSIVFPFEASFGKFFMEVVTSG